MKTKDYVIIALIIIGFCILYLKPDNEVKIEQKNYDKKLDSIMNNIEKSEVKQFKTIQNVTNNIIENKVNKVWYSQSDSLRLIFIDSTLKFNNLK